MRAREPKSSSPADERPKVKKPCGSSGPREAKECSWQPTFQRQFRLRNLSNERCRNSAGSIVAFNNAGIEQAPTPLLEQDEETYDHVMDINVKGVWLSMKYEIPAMLKTGGGSTVNTSSGAGVIGMPAR